MLENHIVSIWIFGLLIKDKECFILKQSKKLLPALETQSDNQDRDIMDAMESQKQQCFENNNTGWSFEGDYLQVVRDEFSVSCDCWKNASLG